MVNTMLCVTQQQFSKEEQRGRTPYHAAFPYLEDTVPMCDEDLETTRALGSRYKGRSSCSLLWATAGRSTSMPGPWTSLGIIVPEESR